MKVVLKRHESRHDAALIYHDGVYVGEVIPWRSKTKMLGRPRGYWINLNERAQGLIMPTTREISLAMIHLHYDSADEAVVVTDEVGA